MSGGVVAGRPPIRLLPPQVADAIAAGEVIERPAAVVKELCENALDAGARRIEVEVEGGGLVRIAVSDDGAGIPGDQLALAVARHATSKVNSIDDLVAVRSLGFRGEALASIAAVSELRLLSRVTGSEAASVLRCRGGEVVEHRPAARGVGTTAEVCDLYHNTPARLAFLRAERAEAAVCVRAVSDLALTHPEVSFTCRSAGRLALRTPGGTLREAAAAVFGRDAGELLEVVGGGEITVSGLIGEPRRHRGTRAGLVVVLNRRRVHNRALVAAVEEAYAGLLPVGRHPFGVVTIALDPAQVDVNVHPTKREVRLRDEGRVFAAIQRACWAALQGAHLGVAGLRQPQLGEASSGWRRDVGWELRDGPRGEPANSLVWLGDGGGVLSPDRRAQLPPATGDHRLAELAPMHPLAQTADGWLVANSPRGLCLVDPHAAHEKVLYAELMAAGDAAELASLAAPSQPLLIEATVSVDADAVERLLDELGPAGRDGFRAGGVRTRPGALPGCAGGGRLARPRAPGARGSRQPR